MNLSEKDKINLLKDLINSKDLREELESLYSDEGVIEQTVSIWHLILLAKESLLDKRK